MNLYTVTTADRIDSISNSGLNPEAGGSRFSHGSYGNYSSGRVFLSDASGVRFWHEKISNMVDHGYDNTIMHFPVVLKVDSNNINLTRDDIGSKDSRTNSFFTDSSIPPDKITWWDGSSWKPLSDWDIERVIEDKKIVDYEIDEEFTDDEYYYDENPYSNFSFVDYPFNVNLSESDMKITKLTEVSLFDLSPKDREKAQKMYDQMKKMQDLSIKSYESGDYEAAEKYDQQYEKVSEELDSFLEMIEDFGHSGEEPDEERDFDFRELENEMSSAYHDFISGSYHISSKEELINVLKSIVKNYSWNFGGFNEDLPDEYFVNLAKEFYQDRKSKKINEDDEQRVLRSKHYDTNHLLPNIYIKFNGDWNRPIPYRGGEFVIIYRGISDNDPNKDIRPGDWVSLNKKYASLHGGTRVLSKKVPADKVVWAGTDENEWFYIGD